MEAHRSVLAARRGRSPSFEPKTIPSSHRLCLATFAPLRVCGSRSGRAIQATPVTPPPAGKPRYRDPFQIADIRDGQRRAPYHCFWESIFPSRRSTTVSVRILLMSPDSALTTFRRRPHGCRGCPVNQDHRTLGTECPPLPTRVEDALHFPPNGDGDLLITIAGARGSIASDFDVAVDEYGTSRVGTDALVFNPPPFPSATQLM